MRRKPLYLVQHPTLCGDCTPHTCRQSKCDISFAVWHCNCSRAGHIHYLMPAGADTIAVDHTSTTHPAAAARCTRGAAVKRLMPLKIGGWYAMIRSASHSAASSSTAAVRSIVTSAQLQWWMMLQVSRCQCADALALSLVQPNCLMTAMCRHGLQSPPAWHMICCVQHAT